MPLKFNIGARKGQSMPEQKPAERMSRASWDAQKVFGELATWNTWAMKTLAEFSKELERLRTQRGLPVDDVSNLAVVKAGVDEVTKTIKKMDPAMYRATKGRVRAKKGAA